MNGRQQRTSANSVYGTPMEINNLQVCKMLTETFWYHPGVQIRTTSQTAIMFM